LPFYAMRFIDGQPLHDAISEFDKVRAVESKHGERLLAVRRLLGRFNAVCDAVAFAHSRGILHRDIKPANVILGRFGETILADWGLAKEFGAPETACLAERGEHDEHGDVPLTEQGSVLGTLPYMSPEQAQSATGPLGAASDIYSLGATLYHLLTGHPPFVGNDDEAVRRKVIQGDFPSPRRVDPEVPAALEAIVLKAMANEPSDRYLTATGLAEDIEHWLADEPVSAWREPLTLRTVRRIRHHRTLALSTAAALFVGVIGLAGSSMVLAGKNRELDSERRQAVAERNRAERARDLAFRAAHAIISTDTDQMLTEEARPYRAMLLDEGLRLSREMIEGSEGDARAEKLRAQALMMEAKVLVEKGERARAAEVGQRAVDLLEGLLARDSDAIDNRVVLAQTLHEQATLGATGETNRSNSRRSNTIYMALLREHPQGQEAAAWIGEIAVNLHNIGHEYFWETKTANGDKRLELLRKAIGAFREGRKFCEQQITQEDRRDKVRYSLALNARYLCRAYREEASLLKDPAQISEAMKKSTAWGQTAIDDFQVLVDRDAGHYRKSYELHQAQRELGIAFLDQASWDDAAQAFKKARETLALMRPRHGKLISRMVAIQDQIAIEDHNLLNALTSNEANEKQIRELVKRTRCARSGIWLARYRVKCGRSMPTCRMPRPSPSESQPACPTSP
jgi:hypothetical protein